MLLLSSSFVLSMYYITIVIAYEIAVDWGRKITNGTLYTVFFGLFVFVWMLALIAMQIVHKWLFVGKFCTDEVRLSTDTPFGRLCRLYAIHQCMNISLTLQYSLLHVLHGTVFHVLYLNALGAKVSESAMIITSELLFDFDLIHVGKGAVLDTMAQVVAHNFSGFRLRHGVTRIDDHAVVGPYSYVQCGNHIGTKSTLLALSKILVGQIGPSQTWGGVPAHRIAQGGTTLKSLIRSMKSVSEVKLQHGALSSGGSAICIDFLSELNMCVCVYVFVSSVS